MMVCSDSHGVSDRLFNATISPGAQPRGCVTTDMGACFNVLSKHGLFMLPRVECGVSSGRSAWDILSYSGWPFDSAAHHHVKIFDTHQHMCTEQLILSDATMLK